MVSKIDLCFVGTAPDPDSATSLKTRAPGLNKKEGLVEYESPTSPKIASPKVRPDLLDTLPTGYFGDLAVTICLSFTAEAGSLDSLVAWVGTVESGLRPGREP